MSINGMISQAQRMESRIRGEESAPVPHQPLPDRPLLASGGHSACRRGGISLVMVQ